MGRFEFAKRALPLPLASIFLSLVYLVFSNSYLTIVGLVVSGALGARLVRKKRNRSYLEKPLKFFNDR
jgi:LPXTG-motif cell wall-anchored protein